MKEKIAALLNEFESQKDLKILMAVESGSRAWGFPSPDSDYDIRIVFIRKSDWYLSINNKKDTLDYFQGKLLDINAWDIRKTLSLLRKSNATPFEWAQSPIVYSEVANFRQELLALAAQFFQPYHSLNHYKGIAKNSYLKNDLTKEIKLKKLFYVIRPLFAINWIKEKMSIPPMDIFNLMEIIEDVEIKTKINDLIKIKAQVNEDFVYTIDPVIKSYIDKQFKKLESYNYDDKKDKPDIELLNQFYRNLLKKYG